jgi:hypothetical protein
LRFLRRLLRIAWEGLADGWRSRFDPTHEYAQEQERRRIAEHTKMTGMWTDEEVYLEFLGYILVYDTKMRLTRTHQLLTTIMDNRPALRDKELRERIRTRQATRR